MRKIVIGGIKLCARSIGILVECLFLYITIGNDISDDRVLKFFSRCEKWIKDYVQWCEDRFERWRYYPKTYFRAKYILKDYEAMKKEMEEETECY